MKSSFLFFSLVSILGLSACTRAGAGTAASTPVQTPPAQSTPAQTAPVQTAAADNSGAMNLLQTACTTCHDLSAITSNPGAYTEADFRDTVQRMIGYGAPVAQDQVEGLVSYLTQTYGP